MKDSVTETITLGDGTPFITFGDVPNGSAEITFVFKKGDTLKLGQTRMVEPFDAMYFDVDAEPKYHTTYPGYPNYYYNDKTITAKQDVKLTLTSQYISGNYANGNAFSATLYTATYTPAN